MHAQISSCVSRALVNQGGDAWTAAGTDFTRRLERIYGYLRGKMMTRVEGIPNCMAMRSAPSVASKRSDSGYGCARSKKIGYSSEVFRHAAQASFAF